MSVLLAVLLAGCAGSPGADADGRLVLAAKVAPLADLAAQVVGDHGDVHSLVPAGVDAHTYEPAPSDVLLLSKAQVFLANGLGLNDGLIRLAEANMPKDGQVVRLAELVLDDVSWDAASPPNPHVWMDVSYAGEYVRHIAAAVSAADPANAAVYERNAERYRELLAKVDAAITAAVKTVPQDRRKLVTYHDSWEYFAPRYGLRLVAAVQPVDFAEPSAADVRRIIDDIRATGTPAVFGSEAFPSDIVATISRETGVRYVGDLSDDVLPGEPGSPEHSYVGMMLRNAATIVEALGGSPSAIEEVSRRAGINAQLRATP